MKGRKPIDNEPRETLSLRVKPSARRDYQKLRARGWEASAIADVISDALADAARK